jgi:hypothetical protein
MARRRATGTQIAAAVAALLAPAIPTGAAAMCSQADLDADRTVGPMVGFLAAPPPTAADRATAQSRLHEIRAMVAPYRRAVDPPRDIARYTAAGMLVPVRSPPGLAERGPWILLYRESRGALRLEAVEFARDTPVRELNAILPLSVARWHQLTRHCTAPPAYTWVATVFPYAHGDGAIWRTLEVPKYVQIAPYLPTPARSGLRASR